MKKDEILLKFFFFFLTISNTFIIMGFYIKFSNYLAQSLDFGLYSFLNENLHS